MFFDFFKYEPTKSSTLKTAVMKKINLVTFAHLTIFDPLAILLKIQDTFTVRRTKVGS